MTNAEQSGPSLAQPRAEAPQPPIYFNARPALAAAFLFGEGLEIGPLHQPLPVPAHVKVRYVDRMTVPDLRAEYPELREWPLAEVDVVDDGERLETIAPESQDFIVANHFLEHCEDPIGTIETHLSKLRPGGVLFYAVPDKRYTFDHRRRCTPIEHMVEDHEAGAERSRREHYDEWVREVFDAGAEAEAAGVPLEEWAERRARELEAEKYSIHMHVWTQAEFLRLILTCRERLGDAFDIEAAAKVGLEFVVVLRKAGALPAPTAPDAPPTPPAAGAGELQIWKHRLRRVLHAVRNDARRWRSRP